MRCAVGLIACAILPLLSLPAAVEAQSATLRGRITDTTGTPVAQAAVIVEATGLRTSSNDQGEYVIAGVPAGSYTVRVRRLGFLSSPVRISLGPGDEIRQDFSLATTPTGLAPIEVVVGSRAIHSAADELAVPVDVFTAAEIRTQGTTETSQILSQLAPSVNFPRQSVSDGTEIVRPFTMRGLSPDHTLVLLNGKRRHRTALVHYFGAGMGAGSSGVDMNALPASAIERLEVLRDGAAAQYGSDAIAGVVNLVLKRGIFDPTFTVDVGRYFPRDFPRDGTTFNVSGGIGLPVGRGSLSMFGEYRDRDGTNRAGADPVDQIVTGDADQVGADGRVIQKRNPVPQPNHHWGDGEQKDLLTFASAQLPLGETGSSGLYAFGGYSLREGRGYGYYRQGMSERNWPQIYPLGFLPRFEPDVVDVSAAGGVRGTASGWSYDLGTTIGHNSFEFKLENTMNTSLGPCLAAPCAPGRDGTLGTADDPGIPNQTSFFAGQLKLYEGILSLDANKSFHIGLASPLNLAVGVAFRRENYQVIAGERASHIQGGHPDRNGDIAPAGSQVFPGFRPEDEADESRSNFGAYVDVESDLVPRLLVNVAGRFESYSDFGERLTGKLALRFQPSTRWTVRGAVSTGFRAPSLNQSFYSSTVTNFKTDPVTGEPLPFEIGLFPVASREARVLGARPLEEETSVNVSGGFAFTPMEKLNFTADYFYVSVNDRIMLTTFLGTDSVASILRNAGSRAEAAQYFTNAIDTHTQGVDVTANYEFGAGSRGVMNLNAVFNYTKNEIVGDIPLPPELEGTDAVLFDEFGEGGLLALERERPKWRSTLSAHYLNGPLSLLGRAAFYGNYTSALYSYLGEFVQDYPSEGIFDAEVGYAVREDVKLSVGGRNLFDNFPDRMREENSFGLFLYPPASPFGFNGRFIYSRLEFQFGR